MVALSTIDQSKLTLVHLNDPEITACTILPKDSEVGIVIFRFDYECNFRNWNLKLIASPEL